MMKEEEESSSPSSGRRRSPSRSVLLTMSSLVFLGVMLVWMDSTVLFSAPRSFESSSASSSAGTAAVDFESPSRGSSNKTKNPSTACCCWLDPPWGTNVTIIPTKNDVASSTTSSRACAIRVGQSPDFLVQPYTTASRLRCSNNGDGDSAEQPSSSSSSSSPIQTMMDDENEQDITVILLYYANPSVLKQQMDHWAGFPKHLRDRLRLLIVDDGSPEGLQAQEYLKEELSISLRPSSPPPPSSSSSSSSSRATTTNDQISSHKSHHHASNGVSSYSLSFPIRVVRVVENLVWNIPGAQNLGVHVADTAKILLLDLDSFVKPHIFERLLTLPLSNEHYDHIAYRFYIPGGEQQQDKSHNKIAFLRKDSYWSAGGYDEDFVGHYGHDDYAFWYRFRMNPRSFYEKIDTDPSRSISGSNSTDHHHDRLYVYYQNNPAPCAIWKDRREHHHDRYTKCESALQTLPHPPKREDIPVNRKLFFRRKFTQCWSNLFLRFDWTTDLRIE